jgi:hypothetical protein
MLSVELTSCSDIIACYDFVTDTIILNRELFKKGRERLLQRCIEHEMLHAKNKGNIKKQLWVDLTDNWKHFFDYDIIKQVQSLYPIKQQYKQNVVSIVNIVITIVFIVPSIIQLGYMLLKKTKEAIHDIHQIA